MTAAGPAVTALRLWDALPAFLVSGIAVCAATGLVLLVAPGVTPFTLVLFALVPGPLFAALVDQSVRALAGDTPHTLDLPAAVRRSIRRALGLLVPPALVGALALVAMLAAQRSGSWLPLVPAAVGTSVGVLLLVGALVGLPLGAARPGLDGARLTLAALHTAARRPVPVLGTIAVVVIAGWAATQFSGTLLFLLPAPLAVTSAIAVADRPAPTPAATGRTP